MNDITLKIKTIKLHILWALCGLIPSVVFAQVEVAVDSVKARIGEQITYEMQVEADSSQLVIFPEGQTFMPLEVIESFKTDSFKQNDRYRLIKKYGLTQFDSGRYTIPGQKVVIGDKVVFTDSLDVEIMGVAVDTTKQKLYDIKPIIQVDKGPSSWWVYLISILLIIAAITALIYWFVWRKKPMTLEERIAILPPYERAKLALKELDKADYLERNELKAFYSDLTLIIRKYLDEKVYDHSLESTTNELIGRLMLLKDGNQIELDNKTISNIETILRRADLVKFAKSKPDPELAKLDLGTIDMEIDHVKESLPEPTEEERLADLRYKEELAKRKRKKKILITVALVIFILAATVVGFGLRYGFTYVKDTVFGHPTKTLLENRDWVRSEYGAPGVTISTPEVLERQSGELSPELEGKVQKVTFGYGKLGSNLYITVSTTKINPELQAEASGESDSGQPAIDLRQAAEGTLVTLEGLGVQNIITKNEQFITPNGQEGLKTFGTADFPLDSGDFMPGKYVHLGFTAENVLQQVILAWQEDDNYADEIIDRVLKSIELITLEEDE
ncbi:MAG: hypothetical protein HKN00_02845 [Flavobacteriaceae bacterium]|nr:hypothetical protein [Bacteroidia bacterium]NNF74096.1 hypothetical protein [Flavobacteriaceae bacterium]NNK71805.1 hypothetical protein [Flavobacteriaceae bacterium]